MAAILLDKSSKCQQPFSLRKHAPGFSTFRDMGTDNRHSEFNRALCERVQALRNRRGFTSEQMAIALGIPAERYRKYETRTPLPAWLWERFALIVGCDLEYLLTGRGAKPGSTAASGQKPAA